MLAKALTEVPLRDLENLLRRIHRRDLSLPLTHQALVVGGFAHLIDRVRFLHGLSEDAVRAVLVAVIAERRADAAKTAAAVHCTSTSSE